MNNVNNVKMSEVDELKCAMDRFFSIEGLGIQCLPQCGGCKCGKCAIGSSNYTIQEEKELKMIEDGLISDEKSCAWTVTYPVKKDYGNLPNNLPSAIQRLNILRSANYQWERHMQRCIILKSKTWQTEVQQRRWI